MAKFIIYKDAVGEYRWNFKSNNGDIIADSGEGYVSKEGARNGIVFVKTNAPGAPIEDTTPAW